MTDLLYIELFSLGLFLLIVVAIRSSHEVHQSQSQKYFLKLTYASILMLLLDFLTCICNHKPIPFLIGVNWISNFLYFITLPLLPYFYLMFCISKINNSKKIDSKTKILWLIPFFLNAIIIFGNLFTGYIFTINGNNTYVRGELFYFQTPLPLFYIFVTIIYLIYSCVKEKSYSIRKDYFSLLGYFVFPVIGMILQFVILGLDITWVCIAISIFIVYSRIQNGYISTDSLTKIFNRRYMDKYLLQISSSHEDIDVYLLMIDIDHFKKINDAFGHVEGDKALKHTAMLLKKSLEDESDFLARYGGDEFVIVLKRENEIEVVNLIQKIHENFIHFNENELHPYVLEVSIGYACWQRLPEKNIDQWVKKADSNMYSDKKRNI